MIHPAFTTLSRYADDSLAPAKRSRIAAHLVSCSRCRVLLQEVAAVRTAAAHLSIVPPTEDAWSAIARRRAGGDRVILPTDDDVRPKPRRATLPAVAAAVAILLLGAGLLLRAPELVADASELHFIPSEPRSGERVEVLYRATGKLAGEEYLVLRAQLFGDPSQLNPLYVELAKLQHLEGRTYTGSFVVSEDLEYAVFSVESPDGERLDHDPQTWDLLVYARDGRPLLSSLGHRLSHRQQWSTDRAIETAREMVRLYPDSLQAWQQLYYREREYASEAARDSLKSRYRKLIPQFERSVAAGPGASPVPMARLVFFADAVGDSVVARHWRDRLISEHPNDLSAIQQRTFAVSSENRSNSQAQFAAYEELWEQVGPTRGQLPFSAFMLARREGNAEMLLHWGTRLADLEPDFSALVARSFSEIPALRREAMDRLRVEIRRLGSANQESRPLHMTARDFRQIQLKARGSFLGQLGRILLAEGHPEAALDTLDLATESIWDPDLFRTIGRMRLDDGDKLGALRTLALVAADPTSPSTFSDSVRLQLAGSSNETSWNLWVEQGRQKLREYLSAQGINRPVRGSVRLVSGDGIKQEVDFGSGVPTLIAFWSRFCTPSALQLEELDQVIEALRTRGMQAFAVTDEPPSAAMESYLVKKELSFTVYHDSERTAQRAMENRAVPTYVVIDGRGRIRFESHVLDDVVRQMAMLQGR